VSAFHRNVRPPLRRLLPTEGSGRTATDSIVLCYHALSPGWDAALSTTPTRFEHQLELLLARGFRGVRFTDAVRPNARDRTLAVTFDDAYRSVIELAFPILERLGVPGTVFVPTDYIGAGAPMRWPGIDQWLGGPFEHELTPMSWAELRSLADSGWEIGSHTASHPHLTRLDDTALEDELTRSRTVCEEHMSRPCTSLAYPYGDVDARVVAATATAGYDAAAALPQRLDSRGALEWPRVGVYRADDDLRFRLKVSRTTRRLRASPAWSLARSAHSLVRRR
jgi:peptidoglycan/xylan/chitin deacetylase (PgdA/CDA1 family)